MKRFLKTCLLLVLMAAMALGLCPGTVVAEDAPIEVSIWYSDNPTLPFMDSWLALNTTAEIAGLDVTVEAIPSTDFATRVSPALNTGMNLPDVILYQNTQGENASLALNGRIVPISDYSEWTPHFNAMVEKLGLQEEVDQLKLQDGKRYFMPQLFDKPFYMTAA